MNSWLETQLRKVSKYSHFGFLCIFSLAINLILETPSSGGYVIVKNEPCSKSEPCISPVSKEDPYAAELYTILLEQTWPTNQLNAAYDTSHSEKVNLQKALENSPELRGNYQFLWIPNTLEDLSCGATLLQSYVDPVKSITQVELHGDNISLHTGSSSSPFGVENVESGGSESIDPSHYFRAGNQSGEKYFYSCNQDLVKSLISIIAKTHDEGMTKTEIQAALQNPTIRKKLRARMAGKYQSLATDWNRKHPKDYSQIIETAFLEENPEANTLLDRVITLEMEGEEEGKALLFRGTNGIEDVDGRIALDATLIDFPRKGRTKDLSLSFGSSLLAGMLRDSRLEGSACAMRYINGSRFGYAVKIAKNSQNPHFEIPPLGLVGRLYGEGEFFHPRTKIGIKGQDLNLFVNGVFGTRYTIEHLKKLGFAISSEKTPFELAQAIDQYLSENAIIITPETAPITQVKEILQNQRDFSTRQGNFQASQVDILIENFKSPSARLNSNIRKAILAKLGQIFTHSDFNSAPKVSSADASPSPADIPLTMVNKIENICMESILDSDSSVAEMAARVLAAIAPIDSRSLKRLSDFIPRIDYGINKKYIPQIFLAPGSQIDREVLQVLAQLLKHNDQKVRYIASLILMDAKTIDQTTLSEIRSLAAHENPEVREVSLEVIREILQKNNCEGLSPTLPMSMEEMARILDVLVFL